MSRSSGGHDRRFTDTWKSVGFDVAQLAIETQRDADTHANNRLSRLINDFRPDVVQVGPVTHPGWDVIRAWDGPLIVTSWGFDLLQDIDRESDLEGKARAVLERADLLFVDNDASAKRAVELGIDAARIAQFPWGLDEHWFFPRETPPLDDSSAVTVLCTRRHESLYRVGDVVNSFIDAALIRDNLELKLIGSGTLTPELKALATASGLGERIEFMGEIDNISLPNIYRNADVYVTASEVDGTSVSLLEAMASGTVVLASLNEGNAQWVSAETGYGFAVGDTSSLTASILDVSSMRAEAVVGARQRAVNARAKVETHARWSENAARFPEFARDAVRHRAKT